VSLAGGAGRHDAGRERAGDLRGGLGAGLAATGLALYKPVQLSWLIAAFGGFRLTRIWHFLAMCGLLVFVSGHLVMVALHGWSNFASMWTGSKGGRRPSGPSIPTGNVLRSFVRGPGRFNRASAHRDRAATDA